jgi:hypothetical protein
MPTLKKTRKILCLSFGAFFGIVCCIALCLIGLIIYFIYNLKITINIDPSPKLKLPLSSA